MRDSLSDEMMSLVTRDIKWLGGTTGCVGVGQVDIDKGDRVF